MLLASPYTKTMMTTNPVKIPYFRTILSYLWDQRIEVTESIYNDYLEICLSRGRWKLNSENATYSHEDLYTNFYKVFKHINIQEKSLERVLILGFGLGSVVVMLENEFAQSAQYVGVEIDEVILDLCYRYLEPKILKDVELFCMDAFDFTLDHQQSYDLIIVDVFIDTITPNKFRSKRFLTKLSKMLRPEGLLLYNTLTFKPEDANLSETFYRQQFSKYLPHTSRIAITGNVMLISQKDKS